MFSLPFPLPSSSIVLANFFFFQLRLCTDDRDEPVLISDHLHMVMNLAIHPIAVVTKAHTNLIRDMVSLSFSSIGVCCVLVSHLLVVGFFRLMDANKHLTFDAVWRPHM